MEMEYEFIEWGYLESHPKMPRRGGKVDSFAAELARKIR